MHDPAPHHAAPPAAGHGPRIAHHDGRLREALTRLFGDNAAIAAEVRAVATFLELRGGQVLFHEGDPGDAAFVVVSGRLRAVVDTDDGEQVLSDASRGETVGELALLTGQSRSATVYAVRESTVARIGAADFESLLRTRPGLALPITRMLAERLRRVTGAGARRPLVERTVAVVPVGRADAGAFATGLAEALRTRFPTDLLSPATGATHETLDALLEQDGAAGRVVVCAGDPGWTGWNDLVLRHAEEVILLADAEDDPAPGAADAAVLAPRERGGPRVTLVLRHAPGASPSRTYRWLDPRPDLQHLHVRADDPRDVARVARWVTGTSVGLVLGGGGARGFAHIGALRAMEELGIPIDLVGGTSQGAVIGAAIADLRTAEDMQTAARPWVGRLRDYTIPIVSLMRGRRLGRTLTMVVRPGIHLEDLWLPFFAMATNLSRAERVVEERGEAVAALRASVALPVVLPPVVRNGELLIDGGLLDNLPVSEMRRRRRTGTIIAIDPSPNSLPMPFDSLEPDASGFRLLAERFLPGRRRRVPSIGEVIQRTVMAGSLHLRQHAHEDDPDTLLLEPQLGEWGLLAFERLDEIVDAGYREMRAPIAAWWVARRPPPGA